MRLKGWPNPKEEFVPCFEPGVGAVVSVSNTRYNGFFHLVSQERLDAAQKEWRDNAGTAVEVSVCTQDTHVVLALLSANGEHHAVTDAATRERVFEEMRVALVEEHLVQGRLDRTDYGDKLVYFFSLAERTCDAKAERNLGMEGSKKVFAKNLYARKRNKDVLDGHISHEARAFPELPLFPECNALELHDSACAQISSSRLEPEVSEALNARKKSKQEPQKSPPKAVSKQKVVKHVPKKKAVAKAEMEDRLKPVGDSKATARTRLETPEACTKQPKILAKMITQYYKDRVHAAPEEIAPASTKILSGLTVPERRAVVGALLASWAHGVGPDHIVAESGALFENMQNAQPSVASAFARGLACAAGLLTPDAGADSSAF
jgi:hypothetical protein